MELKNHDVAERNLVSKMEMENFYDNSIAYIQICLMSMSKDYFSYVDIQQYCWLCLLYL